MVVSGGVTPYWNNRPLCMPNPNFSAFLDLEISVFLRTDEQTDMARSTRLVILIKNIVTINLYTFYSNSNRYNY